jgi:hypothetical protein
MTTFRVVDHRGAYSGEVVVAMNQITPLTS